MEGIRLPFDAAVKELENIRLDLRKRLATLDVQRNEIESELASVNNALSALQATDEVVTIGVVENTGKYQPLWEELRGRDGDEWAAKFSDVEVILDFDLPDSARKYLPAWYGSKGSAVAKVIRDAGWRASKVDLNSETLVFVRR